MRDLSVFLIFLSSVLYINTQAIGQNLVTAEKEISEQEIEVVMRTIGHEVLKAHGDITSRVSPIRKEEGTYVIQFETKFVFQANKLAAAVDGVVQKHEFATNYLVEMEDCLSKAIIHSYQVNSGLDLDAIPCGVRAQPKACYNLRFTGLGDSPAEESMLSLEQAGMSTEVMWMMSIFLTLGLLFFVYQKRAAITLDPHIITIGSYQFDPHKMLLSKAELSVELTSKESDLLSLLYGSANTTISRDDILHQVWGDKGDYVGRTLDVFISKLRKKLEGDPNVKIANIRGVGYRLVM